MPRSLRVKGSAAGTGVVGVLIEVPVMLLPVRICLKTQGWFPSHQWVQRLAKT